MNDPDGFRGEDNGFTNADILQWLRTFAAFILEFLNLISDIILLAFGMKGRFMSRFSCCSKCLSPDDMSVSDIEFSKITDSLRDLSIDDDDSASSTSEHAEDLVSVSSVESSRFESKNRRVRRSYRLKSRIPRLISSCGNVSKSDTEDASPNSTNDRYNWNRLSAMAPLYFIHEFNSFVRENNRRLHKTHLKDWHKKFHRYVHINEMNEQSKSLSSREKTVLNAIREKRDDLVAKLYEFHKRKHQSEAMAFNAFHADLNFKSDKCVRKFRVESNGESGDSIRNATKETEDDKTEVSTANEVYPVIEKVTENKKINIGGGEIMHILTKHSTTAKKKSPGDKSAPEHGRYPKIYPLPITPQDKVCRTVKTEYKIGKDLNDVLQVTMYYDEEHECSPSPYNCITCQEHKERGHLKAEVVKAKIYRTSYSQLKTRLNKSDLIVTTKNTQQTTDEAQPTRVVVDTPATVSCTKVAKFPIKGAQCHNKETRIVKGLARNKITCPVHVKTDTPTYHDYGSTKNTMKPCSTPFNVETANTSSVIEHLDQVIGQQGPVIGQEGHASGKHTVENGNKSPTRIITSAKRRLISKSVPPSMERRKTDAKSNMSPRSYVLNKHFPKDAWSIDGPTNEVNFKRKYPVPNTNGCINSLTANDISILTNYSHEESVELQPLETVDDEKPLEFIDTDVLPIAEPKEPVYQDIDATVDLSRNTVEPRYGESPNRKKLQAEIQTREKIKTKGEANKHLKAKPKFEKYIDDPVNGEYMTFDDAYGGGDSIFKDSLGDAVNVNDEVDLIKEEEEEDKPAELVVVNAVEQPQTMDDREFKMVPEEILRKDTDKLKDLEEMYAVADKKDKKKRKEKKNNKKKLTIPLTY